MVGLLWLSFPICLPEGFTFSLVRRLRETSSQLNSLTQSFIFPFTTVPASTSLHCWERTLCTVSYMIPYYFEPGQETSQIRWTSDNSSGTSSTLYTTFSTCCGREKRRKPVCLFKSNSTPSSVMKGKEKEYQRERRTSGLLIYLWFGMKYELGRVYVVLPRRPAWLK